MSGAVMAHQAIVAQATKASGVVVRVGPPDFVRVLDLIEKPLVVVAEGGVIRKHFKYLASYKGLAFYTKSDAQLVLPRQCEVVVADKVWVPD